MNTNFLDRIIITLALLLTVSLTYGQGITTNTGFDVLAGVPIDQRTVINTLSDTTTIDWAYEGLYTHVKDTDEYWRYTGTQWELFQTAGLNNFYISNDTLYAVSTDSTYSVFLPYALQLADSTTLLRSLIDLAGSQYIDTLQLQGDTLLQISLFGDNQPLKELDLSALSGDNLGNHIMTQNLQTNGNWISGDGGNEGIGVDASGKVGVGTLTPSYILDINSTDAVRLPVGTTAQNPTGADGLLRYNSDLTSFSGYYNAQWNRLVDYDYLSSNYITAEANDLSSVVTWANVPDANITQSSVTQHQAALSITESQISDLVHTPNQIIDTLSYDNTTGILSASLSNDGVAARTVDLDRYYTPGKIPYSDGAGFLTTGNVNYNVSPTYTNGLIDINHTSSWTAALSIDMDGDTTMNNNFSIVPRSSGGQEFNFYTNGQSNASTTNIITHVMNGDPLPGLLNSQLSHMGFFVVRNTGNETDGIVNDTVSSITKKPAFMFFNGNGSDGNFIPEVLGIGVGNTGTTGGSNIVIYHRDSTVDNSTSFPPHNFLYTNSTGVVMSAPGSKFPVTNPLGGTNQLQAAIDSLYVNLGGGGGASQLSDLTDVNTSTPTNRNVLVANGVDWESRPLVEADISDLTHTGNGIFDIANDEATVPAGLNARLGGDFSISNSTGNVFFITKGSSQSVGIGSSSTSAGYSLSVSKIVSGTSGTVGDIAVGSSIAPATTSSLTYNGIVASPVISGTSNKTGDITAAVFYPYNSGSGTISNLYGVKITPITLAGTITNLRSLAIAPNRIVGGAVTNVTNVELGLNGGSYTNYYGVRVLNTSAATTAKAIALELSAGANKHNLYVSGTADNYFEGDVGIGVSSPDYKLDVVGTLGVTGTVRFEGYGQGNKEVGDLALTNSGYLATYATDGTLMEIGLTNPYGGESSITGVLDSLYANQGVSATSSELLYGTGTGITSSSALTYSSNTLSVGVPGNNTDGALVVGNYSTSSQYSQSVNIGGAQYFETAQKASPFSNSDFTALYLSTWKHNGSGSWPFGSLPLKKGDHLGAIAFGGADSTGTVKRPIWLMTTADAVTSGRLDGTFGVYTLPTLLGLTSVDTTNNAIMKMYSKDLSTHFYGNVHIENSTIVDENSSGGNTGEVLSKTATGVDWVDPGSLASYAEMYINLTDPDTISFAGISDSLITETTAGELANFTHSNGRLTYTGSATIKVAVRVSASFTYDNIGTLGLLVYKNGTYQEKSRAEHNILSGEANSARIRPISTNCILTLSQNDYVEVGWETNTAGSTVLTTEDLNVIVTKL